MHRVRVTELMDDPALDAVEHADALQALNQINRRLGVDRSLIRCVRRVAPDGASRILDLGAGGGGFLASFFQSDLSSGDRLLVALDRSAFALGQAAHWQGGELRCVAGDARAVPLADASVDVVTSSLFLHHFDPPDVCAILREASRVSAKGVVMGDLTRSTAAFAATWLATRLLSRSRVFRVDGPRSVRAAYRAAELGEMAEEAGLHGARVECRFPFRAVLMWRKDAQTTIVQQGAVGRDHHRRGTGRIGGGHRTGSRGAGASSLRSQAFPA